MFSVIRKGKKGKEKRKKKLLHAFQISILFPIMYRYYYSVGTNRVQFPFENKNGNNKQQETDQNKQTSKQTNKNLESGVI